nr:ATP-binding protein [Pseudomonadota bacterium]
MRVSSLEGKLALLLIASAIAAAMLAAAIAAWFSGVWFGALIAIVLLLVPLLWIAHATMQPVRRLLRALAGSVASYRDGDFSLSLALR